MFFVALVVICSIETLKVFTLDFAPVHDYAADMLLANAIRDNGVLLVGHYSRFGFHHPGPFWFYWNHLFELCLSGLPLTRFQIWTIGSVVMNASLLFFSGRGLSQYLFGKIKYEAVIILTAVLLLLAGGDFLATWMPNRLIAVYIAFFICIMNICRFNLSYLPWAVLFCAMLIHGYVTMPVLTLPPLAICLIVGYFRYRPVTPGGELYSRLWQAGLIAFIFMAPLAVDILFSPDSNVAKILATQKGFLSSPKPTWENVAGFYHQLVFDQPYARLLYWVSLVAVLPLLALRQKEVTLRLLGMFLVFLLITAIVLVYFKTTPAPLYPFVARFYVGFPSVIVAAVWCALADCLETRSNSMGLLAKIFVAIALVSSISLSKQHESPIWADPGDAVPIRLFADHIHPGEIQGRAVVLNHSQHDQWGIVAGLMVELDRRGIRSCSTWTHMAFLFTPRMICAEGSRPDYMVVKSSECDGQCVAESKGFGLKSFK